MGFPSGYSDVPKLVVELIFFLGFVRRVICSAFDAVGLGDLLEPESPWPEQAAVVAPARRSEIRSSTAALMDRVLPVVRFEDIIASDCGNHLTDSCAVCLYEFEGVEEVRRLANCRHVFHRRCLDRWIGHGQRTCPLCRAPLLPGSMEEIDEPAQDLQPYESFLDDYSYLSTPLPAVSIDRPF